MLVPRGYHAGDSFSGEIALPSALDVGTGRYIGVSSMWIRIHEGCARPDFRAYAYVIPITRPPDTDASND